MKNLFTLRTLSWLVIIAIISSSCSSKMSITKRRYTKGYYITHNTNKHNSKINGREKITLANAEKPVLVNPVIKEEPVQTYEPIQAAPVKPIITAARENKAGQIKTDNSIHKNSQANHFSPVGFSVKQPIKAIQLAAGKKLQGDAADDALSLFWIVILVLLILWAIGLIAGGWGLGGLINILLVIALILLILWLLRIL